MSDRWYPPYWQLNSGYYHNPIDGTGPYVHGPEGVFTLASAGASVISTYTIAQLDALADAGGLTPYSWYVDPDTGIYYWALTAYTLQMGGDSALSFSSFFTGPQWKAVTTNVWTGIDLDDIADRFEAALSAASYSRTLLIPTPCYIKANRPLRYDGGCVVRAMGVSLGSSACVIYPDLSVDWPVVYPDRGVLESSNYTYPTARVDGVAWPVAGPGYVPAGDFEGIAIRCHFDSLWATYPARVPDFGWVTHAPNEGWTARRCNVFHARKQNWLFTGLCSTPTLYNCGAFFAGGGQAATSIDTVFGAAVTRTTGGAFGAAVYVYADLTADTTIVTLEAATSTDLTAIITGNVLTIDGVGYTVAAAGRTTPQAITQRTRTGGSTTTTRYITHVTMTDNVPRYTKGRVFNTGVGMESHPGGAAFAPGIVASEGGNSCGGLLNLYNFSGDRNIDGLIGMGGAGTIECSGPKSEHNNSLAVLHGAGALGGSKAKITVSGYRISLDAPTTTQDQSTVRAIGHSRPSITMLGGQADVANVKLIEDLTTAATLGVNNVSGGAGLTAWCPDSTEEANIFVLRTASHTVQDTNSQTTWVGNNTSYTFRWRQIVSSTDTYRLQVGPSNCTVIAYDGSNAPTGVHFKGWTGSGTTMTDLIAFGSASSIGFYGATPIAKPASTGSRGGNAALASLLTALANLGLITDSTSA